MCRYRAERRENLEAALEKRHRVHPRRPQVSRLRVFMAGVPFPGAPQSEEAALEVAARRVRRIRERRAASAGSLHPVHGGSKPHPGAKQ
jgi:hypothetical protein